MQEISYFLDNMNWTGLLQLLLRVAAVLICVMFHEVSHGLAAYLLGDPTAKAQHRLSLNPLRHIDPFGALMEKNSKASKFFSISSIVREDSNLNSSWAFSLAA